MARLAGSNKHYILAKRVVDSAFKFQKWTDDNINDALKTLTDLMNNPKTAAATRQTIAVFIIKEHSKFANKYGLNPKPQDFIDVGTENKKKPKNEEEESAEILSLTFNEKVG